METRLDIAIVNWNSGNLLSNCLESINVSKLCDIALNVFVIDNASSDTSLDNIAEYQFATLIKNDKNMGFSYACNQAVKTSTSKYLLFLNPDTELFEDTLIKSIEFMQNNEDIAILGCMQVDKQGKTLPSCSRFYSVKGCINDALGLSKIMPKLFKPATMMRDWDHKTSYDVDQVMGSFMMVRKSIFNEVEGFDERYFVYYEDMDLSYRVKSKGYRVYYNADIKIYHEGQGTTKDIKARRLLYSLFSRLKYCYKNMSVFECLIISFFTLIVEPLTRSSLALIKLDLKSFNEVLRGYYYLFFSLIQGKVY